MTATPKATLKALERRDGHLCAWTGTDLGRLVPQHRQGGMGGRKSKHRLSNIVWLDSLINGLIESDAVLQGEARRRGIKISLHADPTRVPVEHAVHGWVLLGDAGELSALTVAEAREIMHDLGIGVAA
jgi:hypothetical protein